MKCRFTNWNWNWNWFGFEINKRPIGVIITKVIKETRIRLWIYSLSKPKTTLITIRGVMIQNEVVGMMYVMTEERERWWISLTLVSNWKWLKQELCRANGGLATSSGHTSSNYSLLVVDWCTLDFGSVVSRCCGRCGVAFSPARIRRTVVSLPWV